jgi:hypothetical protein
MKQLGDKLVNSPICNSNACYESEFQTQDGPVKTWLCMTSGYTSDCGMTTNTSMTEDSEILKESFELTAEIIKDNKQIHDGLVWLLTVITMPDKGMIFPEPIKDTDDWGWTVVKVIVVFEV